VYPRAVADEEHLSAILAWASERHVVSLPILVSPEIVAINDPAMHRASLGLGLF
jgi:hypothetical protein